MALITLNKLALPTGSVVQTVSGISTYPHNITSTSYVDIESASSTTWETAITLSSSSNKVLILPAVHIYSFRNGHNEFRCNVKILHSSNGENEWKINTQCLSAVKKFLQIN